MRRSIRRPAGRAERLRADERGTVAVLAACSFGVVFATAALAVDASRFYLLKRQQQSATDLAAIAASSNLGDAVSAAQASLAANGRSSADLLSVEVGSYVPDPSVAPALRFVPGPGASPNAARVVLRSANASFFGNVLSAIVPQARAAPGPGSGAATADQAGGAVIVTRSVAALQNSASFALGSRLASLDNGFLNGLLGQMLGTRLSLSVMDYQALAAADVDLFGLADALALRVAPKGATYGSLASTQVRLADLLGAAADATGRAFPGAAGALRAMAGSIGPSGPTLLFGSLVSFSSFGSLAVGSSAPVSAAFPVLQLATLAAKLGGGTNEVVADVGLDLPGIAAGNVRIVVGALPTGSTYAAVGPSGTVIQTAQTGLLLSLQIAAAAPLASLRLPLLLEMAPATAKLSSVSCTAGATAGTSSASLAVRPGAVDAWIGTVSDADFVAGRTANPMPAALATAAFGVQVTGLAHATVSNVSDTLVSFSAADIAAGADKTTTTVDYTSSLLSGLFGSLRFGAQAGGLSVAVPPDASGAIAATLRARLKPIDAALSNALASLGLTVGDADTWVRGVRCGQGALVN